jgi:L-threonylcarbamoyladenylate synthase
VTLQVITHENLGLAAESILCGGIALVPTDTVYGLAVHPLASTAIDRLFELKGRPAQKKLPVMVADPQDLEGLGVNVNEPARRILASDLVPGPVTLALGFRAGAGRPPWLDGRYEVAVRIPASDMLRKLIRRTGPLLVTSANRSQEDTRQDTSSILQSLLGSPDLVIEGGTLSSVPSTLVNCNLVRPDVERVGAVPERRIWEIIGGA